jgi:hypothetical protein
LPKSAKADLGVSGLPEIGNNRAQVGNSRLVVQEKTDDAVPG